LTGTIINAAAIIVGGLFGWLAGGLLPERVRGTLVSVLGLVVMALGVEMVLKWAGIELQVIIAVVIGGVIGELLNIEGRLEAFGRKIQDVLGKRLKGDLSTGFVYTTLIYCVGPMAILGAMESGIFGTHRILLAKSSIDGLTAIAFASTLGLGVVFSAISVFIYQGLLTLGAHYIADVVKLADPQLTATGGILIIGLGIKILELKPIRVANLLPALPVVVLLAWLF